MSPETPLIAFGIDDALTIVFIVIGLLSTLAQALAQQRAQKKAAEQKRVPEPGPAVGAGPGAAKPVRRPEAVEEEIAEFLRRAAEGRAGKHGPAPGGAAPMVGQAASGRPSSARPAQAGSSPPRQPRPGPARPRPVPARPASTRSTRPPIVETPVTAEIVEPAAGPVGGRVKAAVAKDLDTSKFRQRAKRLGEATRHVSERTDRRLREKFDREMGQVTGQSTLRAAAAPAPVVPDIPPTGAAGFAAMLRDVDDVREAILLNEILTRPVDRW